MCKPFLSKLRNPSLTKLGTDPFSISIHIHKLIHVCIREVTPTDLEYSEEDEEEEESVISSEFVCVSDCSFLGSNFEAFDFFYLHVFKCN